MSDNTTITPHLQAVESSSPNNITYAEEVRFEKPKVQKYSRIASLCSIFSLIFMSFISTAILVKLGVLQPGWPVDLQVQLSAWFFPATLGADAVFVESSFTFWSCLPFAFTAFGGSLGAAFELGLLLTGRAFQFHYSSFTRAIVRIRTANIAPVLSSIFFFTCVLCIPDSNLKMVILYVMLAAAAGLVFTLLFIPAPPVLIPTPAPLVAAPPVLVKVFFISLQLTAIIIAWTYGASTVATLLIAQATLQLIALLTTAATPLKSTFFYILSTLGTVLLFVALAKISLLSPNFVSQAVPIMPAGSLLMWGVLIASLLGLSASIMLFPGAFNGFRTLFSNIIWTAVNFLILSAKRARDPLSLYDIYSTRKIKPRKTPLRPYYQAHPENLNNSLSIPAVALKDIERSATIGLKALFMEALKGFKLIAHLDKIIPQADVKASNTQKERMQICSDGSQYWPKIYSNKLFRAVGKLFGKTVTHGGVLDKLTAAALSAINDGQLIAYLAESGIASTLAKPFSGEGRGQGVLVVDMRFLEKYATKEDYESYGGVAYLRINSKLKKLELTSVIAPKSTVEIPADAQDPSFRRAEALICASIYYQVISGKHLAEIHMTYNLVEVCMHNAFDAKQQWNHPFRSFMYLHFYAHQLAEEITTEHLVQEGAEFSQIFATTHDSMIDHLNDCYSSITFGEDEDFEGRKEAMTMRDEAGEEIGILPKACIKWELEYFDIWLKYTTALIDIIYRDDKAVQDDENIQIFYSGLSQVIVKDLP
ncbi:MAG: hypothetical protein HRT88_14590, partial [Lentisphaeraceae bacterium]|nr:hypothetical protein [Lentisphaeraceae bacterium]